MLDQVTKAIAVAKLEGQPPIEILGQWLQLTFVRNPGAAFSLAGNYTIIISVVAIIVAVAIVRTARTLTSPWWAVVLGGILGGAVGNLIDRILREPAPFRGHVVDFLELPSWPVFNVADMALVGSAILAVILSIKGVEMGEHDQATSPPRRLVTSRVRRSPQSTRLPPIPDRHAPMADPRLAQVPDGLAGERIDAALARMFGLSRSKAAELAEAGHVQLEGRVVGKSARVESGQLVEVLIPDVVAPGSVPEVDVPELVVLHDDADIVVVDKPVGVAAHPSHGFEGPSVTGVLAARGYRISTSGAPERRGVVQRLDVGTSGVMVLAKSEPAYSHLKQQFRDRAAGEGLPRPGPGPARPVARHHRRPHRPAPEPRLEVRRDRRRAQLHHALRGAGGLPVRQPARGPPRDRADPPDPGPHGGDPAPLRGRRDVRRGPRPRRPLWPGAAVAARRPARSGAPRQRRVGRVHLPLPG